jgi:hypothetical protein
MNNVSKLTGSVIVSLCIAASVFLTGCGGTQSLGAGIPADQPVVSLADVLESPAGYDGKMFVVKGKVTSQCVMLCDFVITDGSRSATIYSQDFKFPKLAVGKPVTVYVQATAGERLILSALGMQLE